MEGTGTGGSVESSTTYVGIGVDTASPGGGTGTGGSVAPPGTGGSVGSTTYVGIAVDTAGGGTSGVGGLGGVGGGGNDDCNDRVQNATSSVMSTSLSLFCFLFFLVTRCFLVLLPAICLRRCLFLVIRSSFFFAEANEEVANRARRATPILVLSIIILFIGLLPVYGLFKLLHLKKQWLTTVKRVG